MVLRTVTALAVFIV
eukprot:Gb_13069 [translate_table: standard]